MLSTSAFVFITTTDTSCNGRPSSEARKIVRRHVITKHHNTKHHNLNRSLESRQTPRSILSADCPRSCQIGKFRLEGYDRHGRKRSLENETDSKVEGENEPHTLKYPEIRNILSSSSIDPFEATALQLDYQKHEFVQHCEIAIDSLLD